MFHIIDDQIEIRDVFEQMLLEFTDDVMSFSCPIAYLEYMNSPAYLQPIAIFSDVRMPLMNGYELLKQVRLVHPFQKFIMVSGNPDVEHEAKNMACMYLCKPFMAGALQEIVATALKCNNGCRRQEIGCSVVGDANLYNLPFLGDLNHQNH
ncbi:MAG: response regulator [Ghiorsea sp.]